MAFAIGRSWLTTARVSDPSIQYPLHLLNLSSVRDFDAKIDKDDALSVLDPRRFRANLISESYLPNLPPPCLT